MAASFKYKIDKDLQRALGVKVVGGRIEKVITPKLIEDVRAEFKKTAPKEVRKAILRDIVLGISPVSGLGKFKAYSKSYKAVIRGEGSFRKVGGKTIFIKGLKDEALLSKASPKKKVSPVSLRLTGEMQRSFKVFTLGALTEGKFRLIFWFKDRVANYHNSEGAGRSKVKRRLLPTENGETFNAEIISTILKNLDNAAKKIAKKLA